MNEPMLKQPPHSQEAEQSLLGALLLDNQAFDRVSWLGENAFYADRHRRIWRALSKVIEAGRGADIVTLCDELGPDLDRVGGTNYIAGLSQNTPSALHINRYAELVHERAVQRQLAQVCTSIAEQALSPASIDVAKLLDDAEGRILRIAESTARRGEGPLDIKPLLARVLERVDELYHRDGQDGVTGLPTGFHDLDAKTAGLQAGDLIIVAGRPSMGKTAFALNIAEYTAVEKRLPVAIFSMEMSGTQLTQRLVGSIGRIDQHKMRTGRLSDDEWAAMSKAIGRLHDAPISIDESASLTALELRARARRLQRQHGKLGLIVVDYLQLMEATSKGEHRATEISEISRSLKALAKELEVPVVALSQLNRAVDGRPDKRPNMSDLRESGALEQDADLILFIYRQVVYTPDMPEEDKHIAEIIIGKQRNGPIGMVPLVFLGQFTRFENYANVMGGTWHPKRPTRPAKVSNFQDYKSAAAGDDSA